MGATDGKPKIWGNGYPVPTPVQMPLAISLQNFPTKPTELHLQHIVSRLRTPVDIVSN